MHQRAEYGSVHRAFALVAFAALLASNVAFNAFRLGGIPIRALVAAAMLALVVILYSDVAKVALRRNLLLLGLAAGLAVLGIFVSVANSTPLAAIIRAVTEVHVQAAVTLMVAAILARICGARACMFAIIGVIGVSACFAVAQMMDIESAWAARRALGPLRNEEAAGISLIGLRAQGLSYSPIQLATQLTLAFAAFLAVREKFRRRTTANATADPAVLFALLALVATCVACGTRSPILGGMIFLAAYAAQRRTPWLPLFLILAAILLYLAWPLIMGLIETSAPRVAKVNDNSALARSTLAYYGLRLFADNPVGYGLAFAPMTMWASYWPDLYTMPAPRGTQENDLHNYALSMLNIYGVGILLLAPIAAKLLRRASQSLIFFVPYVVQILFHNAGPFYNDSVIWFVIAAIAAASLRTEAQADVNFRSATGPRPVGMERYARPAGRLGTYRHALGRQRAPVHRGGRTARRT
jgi:O-Antigen ligase